MMQSSRYTYYHPSREEAKRYADNALKEIKAKMDRITERAGKRKSTPFLTQYESLEWKELERERSIALAQLKEIEKYAADARERQIFESRLARDEERRTAGIELEKARRRFESVGGSEVRYGGGDMNIACVIS